ncbi:hypothetical protein BdWA1_002913 [Babesia duncani]|nr:hypothetical protein BdWA1_003938 [Babesia duncani]KAK2195240.1 hypothetical protein BdWA1_002913 [Babesia duncani]
MKSLLQLQEEREVDEELKQYSEEDEEGSVVSKSTMSMVSVKRQKLESSASSIVSSANSKAANMEARLLRYLKQNMGRVTVKSVLQQFNITAKNEDFMIIQSVIQKTCTMSSEMRDGKKVKYITCKREYFNS